MRELTISTSKRERDVEKDLLVRNCKTIISDGGRMTEYLNACFRCLISSEERGRQLSEPYSISWNTI